MTLDLSRMPSSAEEFRRREAALDGLEASIAMQRKIGALLLIEEALAARPFVVKLAMHGYDYQTPESLRLVPCMRSTTFQSGEPNGIGLKAVQACETIRDWLPAAPLSAEFGIETDLARSPGKITVAELDEAIETFRNAWRTLIDSLSPEEMELMGERFEPLPAFLPLRSRDAASIAELLGLSDAAAILTRAQFDAATRSATPALRTPSL